MSSIPRRPKLAAPNNNPPSKGAVDGGAAGARGPQLPSSASTSASGSNTKGKADVEPLEMEPAAAPSSEPATAPPSLEPQAPPKEPPQVPNPPAIQEEAPVLVGVAAAPPAAPPPSTSPAILTPDESLLKPKEDKRSTLLAMQKASANPEEADTPMISIAVSAATKKASPESVPVKSPPTIQIDDLVAGDAEPVVMDPPKPLNGKPKETPKVEPLQSPVKSPVDVSDLHRLLPKSKKAEITTVHGSRNSKREAIKGEILASKGFGASNLRGSMVLAAQGAVTKGVASVTKGVASVKKGVACMFRGPSLYDFMKNETRFVYEMEPEEIHFEYSIRALYLLLDGDGSGTLSATEMRDLDLVQVDSNNISLAEIIGKARKNDDTGEITYESLRKAISDHYKHLVNTENPQKSKKFLAALNEWKSLPNVFDLNLSLFFLLMTFQFIIFAPVAYRIRVSWGNLIAGGAGLALVLTGLFWAPISFLRKIRQAVERLYHANALATIACFVGFLSAIATMYFYYLIFQINPLLAWYSELFLPWAVNFLCLVGIGCITFWTVSDESTSAMKRDARCLASYTVNCPVDRHLEHAGQLLRLFVERAAEKKARSPRMKALILILRYSKYVVPCLVIPVQSFLLDNTFLEQYKVNNYEERFKPRCTSTIDPWIMYWIGLMLGILTTLISSISFESFLNRVSYRPFRRNNIMMSLLVASTDSIASCRECIPYLPLSKETNLTGFFKIANYLRMHEQGTQLGQASAGFAGILVVDVCLIAGIVVNYYMVSPIDWRSTSIFMFYAAIATYWCFKILMEAVAINESHSSILERLLDYQGKIVMQASLSKKKNEKGDIIDTDGNDEIDEDTAVTLTRIANVRESIEQTYKPVKILGVPATKTMVEFLGTYVFSAIVAVIGNQVADGIAASSRSSGVSASGNGTAVI